MYARFAFSESGLFLAQNFINSFFDAFEEYACKDYIATLYKITRSLSGKKINQELPVKAADGTSITEEKMEETF